MLILEKIFPVSLSISSIFAAFSNPHGKGLPITETTRDKIHATTANSRPGFLLQIRPISSDGLFSLFKPDPQKKMDKELSNKVSHQNHAFHAFVSVNRL